MSYVEKTLSKDEKIKESLKLHWINYVWPVFFSVLLIPVTVLMLFKDPVLVMFLLLPWLVILYCFLALRSIEMVITNKRVVYKKGIIATHTEELKNSKIESVEIRQTITDRLIGTGCICFSGTGTSKVKFESVASPWEVKSRIEEYIGG